MSINIHLFRTDLHAFALDTDEPAHPLSQLYREVKQMDDAALEKNFKAIGDRLITLITPELLQENTGFTHKWRTFIHHFPQFDEPVHFTGEISSTNLNRPLVMADSRVIGSALQSGMKEAKGTYTVDYYDTEVVLILNELNKKGQTGLINQNNVMKMVAIADRLDSKELMQACRSFLQSLFESGYRISTENLNAFAQEAVKLHNPILFEFCAELINPLSPKELVPLLKDDAVRALATFTQLMQDCDARFTADGTLEVFEWHPKSNDISLTLLNTEFPIVAITMSVLTPDLPPFADQLAVLEHLQDVSSDGFHKDILKGIQERNITKLEFTDLSHATASDLQQIQLFIQNKPSIKYSDFYPLSSETAPLIAETLQGNHWGDLITINQSWEEHLPTLGSAIALNRQIKTLVIYKVTASAISTLNEAIKNHPTLSEITIETIDEEALEELIAVLPLLPQLKNVTLSWGTYSAAMIEKIAQLPHLDNLSLNDLEISGDLDKAIHSLTSLSAVVINNVNLSEKTNLSQLLSQTKNLESLKLIDPNLTEEEQLKLAKALSQYQLLNELYFLYTGFNDEAMTLLCTSLSTQTQLQVLEIEGKETYGEAASIKLAQLLSLPHLTSISLPKMTFTPAVMEPLIQALKTHTSLTSLHWDYSDFNDNQFLELCQALSQNHTLTELNISGSHLTQASLQPLLDILLKHPTLRAVICFLYNIDGENKHLLDTFLHEHPEYFVIPGIG
ncbi:MAG: hypothetical protein KDK65_00835 [Chlamydiia bacterium]|nr:hypothetical protein [Chlamydiia bacterium]